MVGDNLNSVKTDQLPEEENRKILEKGYLFGKEVIKKIEDAGMENEKQ